jgi:hypothetical protein
MSTTQDDIGSDAQQESSQVSSQNPRTAELDSFLRLARSNEPKKDHRGRSIRYCNIENCAYSSAVITNIRKHLLSNHNIHAPSQPSNIHVIGVQQLQDVVISAGGRTKQEVEDSIFREVLEKGITRKALIHLIVRHRLLISMVEWPAFHAFLTTLNPLAKEILPTSHNTIRSDILSSWLDEKVVLQNYLRTATSTINISLDIWTSPNRILFLGVVGHFVRQNTTYLSKSLLGLRQIGRHSGEEQFKILRTVLEEYGIFNSLRVIIGDNASTNDTLCRTISSWFQETLERDWDPQLQRIRCLGHIINLIVQAFLFDPGKSFIEEELESYDT